MAQPQEADGGQAIGRELRRDVPTEPGEVAVLLTSTLVFPDPGPLEGVRGRNKVKSGGGQGGLSFPPPFST